MEFFALNFTILWASDGRAKQAIFTKIKIQDFFALGP